MAETKKVPFRLAIALASLTLTLALLLVLPPPASSLAPLGYTWSCASRSCSFWVSTSNHPAYQWNFGDGTLSGISASTSASHFYNTPVDNQFHTANVTLIGHNSLSGGVDNMIACQITYAASTVGIGSGGTCGP